MAFPVFWILLMSSKIYNTYNKGLSDYFFFFKKKALHFKQRKNLKIRQENFLLNDYVIKSNADVIILITWLMLKFLLKSKDML